MEEERIIRLRVSHQPMHGPQDVGLGWLAHGILLVVCQDDHILPRISEILVQVGGHILDIVDTTPQLTPLVEIIDAYQKRFAPTRTVRVLVRIMLWRPRAKGLSAVGWRWGSVRVAVHVRVGADGR